jgi:hypothetical protein
MTGRQHKLFIGYALMDAALEHHRLQRHNAASDSSANLVYHALCMEQIAARLRFLAEQEPDPDDQTATAPPPIIHLDEKRKRRPRARRVS